MSDAAAFEFLDLLLERLPPHWGVVLASRTDPPLASLARLRAHGELAVEHAAAYRRGSAPATFVGSELRGATIGVIGHGRIAKRLCRLALAFDMRVPVSAPETIEANQASRRRRSPICSRPPTSSSAWRLRSPRRAT